MKPNVFCDRVVIGTSVSLLQLTVRGEKVAQNEVNS
jgi:hypothetical protein